MSNFYWDIKYFATVERFKEYLEIIGRKNFLWVRRIVLHHTYIPTIQQWKGRKSMVGLANYYKGLDWDSGPQLFFGPDGIWQGTPIYRRGIHAGNCNPYSIGCEIVGNYDLSDWPNTPPIKPLVLGGVKAMFDFFELPITPQTLVGHRDCNSPKTCPGTKIDLEKVRSELINKPVPYKVLGDGLRLRVAPRLTSAVANIDGTPITFNRSDIFYGIKELEGDLVVNPNTGIFSNIWVQHESKRGFASKIYLEKAI